MASRSPSELQPLKSVAITTVWYSLAIDLAFIAYESPSPKRPCPNTVKGPDVLFSASESGISIVKSISLFSTNSGSPETLLINGDLANSFSM